MSTTLTNAFLDRFNAVCPEDNNTWGDLSSSPFGSWANWTTWHPSPKTITITRTEDFGSSELVQPTLLWNHQGEGNVTLKISDTGDFTGEETTIDLSDGTAKSYVKGRYFRWTCTLETDSDLTLPLSAIPIGEFNRNYVTEYLNDYDIPSASLDSDGFRTVTTSLGLVANVQATAIQGDPYVVDGYFIDAQDSTYARTAKTPTVTYGSVTATDTQFKIGTKSWPFDGNDLVQVDMGTEQQFGTDDWTIEGWFWIDSAWTQAGIITLYSSDELALTGFTNIRILTSGDLDYDCVIDGTQYGPPFGSGITPTQDAWHHVALVRSGSSLLLFLDGTLEDTQTIIGAGVLDAPSNTANIGGYYTAGSWEGYLDEFRISTTARYTTGFTPQTTPFTNDPDTILLLHMEDLTDDGGVDMGTDRYITQQLGGVAVIENKNPLAVRVVDYNGTAWDGTVDMVIRGFGKIKQTSQGVTGT